MSRIYPLYEQSKSHTNKHQMDRETFSQSVCQKNKNTLFCFNKLEMQFKAA